ncbi:hypothetical protein [Pseudomonas sp. 52 E 6]|nr:hypothetical protein [Pseudomonas sp. 52 E 6]
MLALGQRQVSDCAGQATIAVIERVQRDKPEVRHAGAYQRVQLWLMAAGFEPRQEVIQRLLQAQARRCFEMNRWSIKSTRHHLHRLIPPQRPDIQRTRGKASFRIREQ